MEMRNGCDGVCFPAGCSLHQSLCGLLAVTEQVASMWAWKKPPQSLSPVSTSTGTASNHCFHKLIGSILKAVEISAPLLLHGGLSRPSLL